MQVHEIAADRAVGGLLYRLGEASPVVAGCLPPPERAPAVKPPPPPVEAPSPPPAVPRYAKMFD